MATSTVMTLTRPKAWIGTWLWLRSRRQLMAASRQSDVDPFGYWRRLLPSGHGSAASEIGIGGHLAAPPLPHHRAYGSVPRRFDQVKRGQERRGGEDRDRGNTGCAGPVGRPDVRTYARNRSASRRQPPRETSASHAVAVL